MRARAKVLLEAGQENLGGLDAASDHCAAFKYQHTIACLGEVRRADETVVPGTRHYVVEIARARCGRAVLVRRQAWLRGRGRFRESGGRKGQGRQSRRLDKFTASSRIHCRGPCDWKLWHFMRARPSLAPG